MICSTLEVNEGYFFFKVLTKSVEIWVRRRYIHIEKKEREKK